MLGAAIKKDLLLVLRDRGALASLFILPIIFMLVFGAVFGAGGTDDDGRTLAVYHPVDDPSTERLIRAVESSGGFHTARHESPEAVRLAVARGHHLAGLIIPDDFRPQAQKPVPAELVIDEGMSPRVRGPIEGALSSILTLAVLSDSAVAPLHVLEARSPPGVNRPLEGASGFQIAVPSNAVLFGFFLALTVALSFVEERKTGTWRRLMAAPISRSMLLCSRLVPYFVIGLLQMVFLFTTGIVVFRMEIAGSVAGLAALVVATSFCATCLGLFIAAFGGTEKQVGGIGSITLLVMALLGGSMVPRPTMPEVMQSIGLFTPHGWALEGYYDALIREGTTFADVAVDVAAVLGFGVVFALVGALRFRFEE